jgi:hypothetical protein
MPAVSREEIIDRVLKQLEADMINHDLIAIAELLECVPIENLIAYLPEGDESTTTQSNPAALAEDAITFFSWFK